MKIEIISIVAIFILSLTSVALLTFERAKVKILKAEKQQYIKVLLDHQIAYYKHNNQGEPVLIIEELKKSE
jgi:hypothetical protein